MLIDKDACNVDLVPACCTAVVTGDGASVDGPGWPGGWPGADVVGTSECCRRMGEGGLDMGGEGYVDSHVWVASVGPLDRGFNIDPGVIYCTRRDTAQLKKCSGNRELIAEKMVQCSGCDQNLLRNVHEASGAK